MVTIKDLSKMSGFSVTTVSKALNDYSDISAKTKSKIIKLADEMGYIPNATARSLITQKSYTIGVIFDEITGVGLQHPLFSKVLESFKNVSEQEGYDIMFLSKRLNGKDGSFLQHSLRKQIDGVIVLCTDFNSYEMVDLYRSKLPLIVLDFEHPDVLNITSNNKVGIFQAIKYLHDLGHTKIANIYGSDRTYIGGQRKNFFIEAMHSLSLDIPVHYMVEGPFFSKEDGYKAMKKILELEDLPTAVFCASDLMAVGAMQAIRESHLTVPEDISLVGFDGIELGQNMHPRLTTIRQDSRKMGAIAASQLLQMIDNKTRSLQGETISIDTYLITGETTRVLR